jgi:hypothetical protein
VSGQSWGIQCLSPRALTDVRRHFRHFLQAKTPDGTVGLFRFFDPRVWRVYLPTCDSAELKRWFNSIEEFRCEDVNPHRVVRYHFENGKLAVGDVT